MSISTKSSSSSSTGVGFLAGANSFLGVALGLDGTGLAGLDLASEAPSTDSTSLAVGSASWAVGSVSLVVWSGRTDLVGSG